MARVNSRDCNIRRDKGELAFGECIYYVHYYISKRCIMCVSDEVWHMSVHVTHGGDSVARD